MLRSARLLNLPLTVAYDLEALTKLCTRPFTRAISERTGPLLVTFVNPHAWNLAERDPVYRSALMQMDLVLPDGIAVAKAANWLLDRREALRRRRRRRKNAIPAPYHVAHALADRRGDDRRREDRRDGTKRQVARVSFDATSLYKPVFEALQNAAMAGEGGRLAIVGAEPGVAQIAQQRMQQRFPGIAYVLCRDGYGERDKIVQEVLKANADMVLVGMGAPRQEHLLLDLKAFGFKGVAFSCGGFLDQLAQSEAYYPAWIDQTELRWAWRLLSEPRRLWRRYLVEYWRFIQLVTLALIRFSCRRLAKRLGLTSSSPSDLPAGSH